MNPGTRKQDQDDLENQTKGFRDFRVKNDKDVCNYTREAHRGSGITTPLHVNTEGDQFRRRIDNKHR